MNRPSASRPLIELLGRAVVNGPRRVRVVSTLLIFGVATRLCGFVRREVAAMKLNLLADDGALVAIESDGDVTTKGLDPNVDPLKALLGEEVYQKTVLLDVHRSGFMDTSGIGWLVGSHKRFRDAGGQLIIHSVPALQINVLKILKLSTFLWIAADAQAAKTLAAPSRGG